jgi:hypothetical protein
VSAIPSRRRRRAIAAVVTGLVGLVLLPSGLVVGANSLLNETGGNSVDDAPTTKIPVTPTALVAVTNTRNEVAALAMLAVDPAGKGGSIVSIPVGANAEIPKSGTIHRIADSYASGGMDALRADVEGLLNVSFNLVDDVNAAELGALLQVFGDFNANLPAPVLDTAADGTAVPVLEAGSATLTPAQVAAGLASSQTGVAESTRWPSVKELWSAVAASAGTDPASPPGTSDGAADETAAEVEEPADLAGYVAALAAGKVQVWQLAATLLTDPTRNPGNADLYEIDGGEVIMVMASIAPSAIALVSNSIAIMIDTPYDDSALVREAVLRLAYVGANVAVVRTVDAAPAKETTVFYNDVMVRVDVEGYASLLGTMAFVETEEVIEGVNARIVLGEDFREFIGSAVGRTIATTTTSTVPD